MKIGLNATCFNDKPTGANQRFRGMYVELVKRLPETEFVVYEPVDCRVGTWFHGAQNVTVKRTPLPSEGRAQRLVNGLRYWPKALSQDGLDTFEVFSLPLVKAPTGKTLLTIHDIRGTRAEAGLVQRVANKVFLDRSLRSADHVITVSESMKNEILGVFPSLSISVVYNGLDTHGFDTVFEIDKQEVRRKYALPAVFMLAVGPLERHKNYLRLVDAMARLRNQGRSCSLLIVGNDRGELKKIKKRINAANLSGCVKILSGLSDFEVRCLYKMCNLFVFPSSYEGFGIPILEAMAAGCPMVLSDIPVFREITESRGIYFPHDDTEATACAMEQGVSSSSDRARLIEYGNERVHTFSFNSLATQLGGLYRH